MQEGLYDPQTDTTKYVFLNLFIVAYTKITNSLEQILSYENDSRSATPEMIRLL
jgi:hypothetical protein